MLHRHPEEVWLQVPGPLPPAGSGPSKSASLQNSALTRVRLGGLMSHRPPRPSGRGGTWVATANARALAAVGAGWRWSL